MVEAVEIMGVGEILQSLALLQDAALGGTVQEHTQIDVTGKGLELRIQI